MRCSVLNTIYSLLDTATLETLRFTEYFKSLFANNFMPVHDGLPLYLVRLCTARSETVFPCKETCLAQPGLGKFLRNCAMTRLVGMLSILTSLVIAQSRLVKPDPYALFSLHCLRVSLFIYFLSTLLTLHSRLLLTNLTHLNYQLVRLPRPIPYPPR